MGYYANVTDYDIRIVDQERACKLLNEAGFPGTDLVDVLMAWGYEDVEIDAHGNFTMLTFNQKYRNDEVLWRALAPVISPNERAYIEWLGEDHEMWRFVFEDGAMREVGCEILWPYLDEQARTIATVDPLTLEGRAKQLLAQAIALHIQHHIEVDGRDTPLVRECLMALKSVQDADKVVLSMEVVQ
jgi:hypothetical protein